MACNGLILKKYRVNVIRFADAPRTGTKGALGAAGVVAKLNRRLACRTVFCMELVKEFMMFKVFWKFTSTAG